MPSIGQLNPLQNMFSVLQLINNGMLILEHQRQTLSVHSVLLLISSERLSRHNVLLMVNSRMLIVELQNLSGNRECIATYRANATAEEGSKEGKMITLLQLSKGVRLGNLFTTDRVQLLKNSDRMLTLAHLIPAIVVPVCVTTMAGLLLMRMILSSSLYITI